MNKNKVFENYFKVMKKMQETESDYNNKILEITKSNIKNNKIVLYFNYNLLNNYDLSKLSLYSILSNVLDLIYKFGSKRINYFEYVEISKLYIDLENTNNDVKLIYYINYLINRYKNILDNTEELEYLVERKELMSSDLEYLNNFKNYKNLMKRLQTYYNKYLLFELTKNISLYSNIRNYLDTKQQYKKNIILIEDIIIIFNKLKFGNVMDDFNHKYILSAEEKNYIQKLIDRAKIKEFNMREDTFISYDIFSNDDDNDNENNEIDYNLEDEIDYNDNNNSKIYDEYISNYNDDSDDEIIAQEIMNS